MKMMTMTVKSVKDASWSTSPARKMLLPTVWSESEVDMPPPVAWMRKVTTSER